MPKPVQASSEVGTKNLRHCSGVFIVNFEKISRNAPVFPFKKENSISTKYKRNTEVLPLLQGFLCSTNEYGGGEPAASALLIMKVLGCGNWSINTKTFLLKLWLKFRSINWIQYTYVVPKPFCVNCVLWLRASYATPITSIKQLNSFKNFEIHFKKSKQKLPLQTLVNLPE